MIGSEKRLSDFRVLTFDTFGTLIDWETGIWVALAPLRARLIQDLQRDEALKAFATHESAVQSATPGCMYRDLLAVVYDRLAQEWGVRPDASESAAFGASVSSWPAFSDAAESLAYLRDHFRLVTVTNCDRRSYRGANRSLGDPWHAIWTAEDIGSYKPDPRNFEYLITHAKSEFGAAPEDILHVAQSLYHDILPAAQYGLPYTAWINRRHADGGYGATPPPAETVRATWQFATLAEFVEQHMQETR